MKYAAMIFLLGVGVVSGLVQATSFGLMADADIKTIGSKPAICLPINAKEFSVGWISLSESYVKNPTSWEVVLRHGQNPLVLKPGDCVTFGEVPKGFELGGYKIKTRQLEFEANKTYLFRLTGAINARDTYTAMFCIDINAKGHIQYLEYPRMGSAAQEMPACDARRNANPYVPSVHEK